MPTYHFRCLHCRDVQALVQSMHEMTTPPCAACGGFTEKIINYTPTVLSQSPEPKHPEAGTETEHTCGGACVLHRKPRPSAQTQ